MSRGSSEPRSSCRRRLGRDAILAVVLCGLLAPATFARADTEYLDSHRPEAWAMFYFTSVTIFSGLGTPRVREPWSVDVTLELGNIPHLSTEERTVGFDGTKVEDLNNSPFLARPVLTIGLPWRMSFSLAYIPPVEIFGVRPNLLAMALDRPLLERGPWTLGARLHGQVGKSEGAFTCTGHAASNEPGSDDNPFGCDDRSNDRVIQNYVGVELSGSYRFDSLRGLTPYLTLGANYLDTEFHVRSITFGEADNTKLKADTWTFSLGAGLGYPLTDKIWASLGVFYTPLKVDRAAPVGEQDESLVNARAQLTYSLW